MKPFPLPVVTETAERKALMPVLSDISAQLKLLDKSDVLNTFSLPAKARLLKTTISLCHECLAYSPAAVYVNGDAVRIKKTCLTHGHSEAVLENDARYYKLSNKDQWGLRYDEEMSVEFPQYQAQGGCCSPDSADCTPSMPSPAVAPAYATDQSSNKTCTVLVEITDACNLACRVCYADSKGDKILPLTTFKQFMRNLIAQKTQLDSVQITGGEASLHPEFWQIIEFLHAQPGVQKIYLPTNGILFSKSGVVKNLKPFKDKLLVLLQFDGGSAPTNQALRRSDPNKIRQRAIRQLDRQGIAMQLTMTLAHGVSEHEIAWVVNQGRKNKNVRLVAMQPAFFSGRYELEPDPLVRLTLSDVVKGIASGLQGATKESDFDTIPCSHPNCGWVTLFARRFGLFANIARHVDLTKVMDQVAYKTLLDEREMQDIIGTKKQPLLKRAAAKLSRRLIRPKDVFGIAIKPFMDRYNYDQDRVSSCCHHTLNTEGQLVSFCEYNALHRQQDSWSKFPSLKSQVAN